MITLDYPLVFKPILKERIWGGDKLKETLHKNTSDQPTGESWEISNVPGNSSVVENGAFQGKDLNFLLSQAPEQLLGKRIFEKFGKEFPLLIKFIDARTALSVQLHPDDALAGARHNSFGKTEMWYVLEAEKDAELNVGFTRNVQREEYLEYLEKDRITELLHFEKVGEGDAFFIKPGKVHAIGAGVLLAEIQQTSDITYRIYDWGRTDSEGKPRELHTDLALDAIDFEKREDYKMNYQKVVNTSSNIVRCEYFTTNILPVKGTLEKDLSNVDSFFIYLCVKGSATVETNGHSVTINKGETVLIPAMSTAVRISAEEAELLEVSIE